MYLDWKPKLKKQIIVDAFPGTGKSSLGRKHPHVLDMEAGPFKAFDGYHGLSLKEREKLKGSGLRKRNPNFPQNFLEQLKVKAKSGEYDVILIGMSTWVEHFTKFYFDYFRDNNMQYILAMPSEHMLDELRERAKSRGNQERMLKSFQYKYDTINSLCKSKIFKVITINDDEFLEQALVREGIILPTEIALAQPPRPEPKRKEIILPAHYYPGNKRPERQAI